MTAQVIHTLSSKTDEADGRPIIFLTGVTGGLGSALLPRLLRARPEHAVLCLVRDSQGLSPHERLRATFDFADIAAEDRMRVNAICGDISAPDLGLDRATFLALAARTTEIFHLAADLRFDLPIEDSRRSNVDSTKCILDFASAVGAQLRRFNYVSTAYISGTRRDLVRESEINVGQAFFNTYEQSKMEAEELVRQAGGVMPITVYRPSMIVGETGTGRIRNFFGFYEFLKLAELGKVPVVPADPQARPDMVPMDYVANAIVFLSRHPAAAGECFHLAAGLARSMTIGAIVELIGRTVRFDRLAAIPEVVAPDVFEKRITGRLLNQFRNSALNILMRSYVPYLTFERNFEVAGTADLLERNGIAFGPIEELLPVAARYALDHRFGDPAKVTIRRPA
jgi:thioester reductase-like protein